MNYFVKNINRITLNGYRVKTFEVWSRQPDGTEVFRAHTYAPIATADRDLLSSYLDKLTEVVEPTDVLEAE